MVELWMREVENFVANKKLQRAGHFIVIQSSCVQQQQQLCVAAVLYSEAGLYRYRRAGKVLSSARSDWLYGNRISEYI